VAVNVPAILQRIRALEAELERDLAAKQSQWHYQIEARRVRFEREVWRYHRRLRPRLRRARRTTDGDGLSQDPPADSSDDTSATL
jgi:hypothetical protein